MPKLAPTENLLAKAAAPVATVVAIVAGPEGEGPGATETSAVAGDPAAAAGALAAQDAVEALDMVAEGGPSVAVEDGNGVADAEAADAGISADPVVIEAVEADNVILLPPPDAEVPAATLESVATTPSVGETPAEVEAPPPEDTAVEAAEEKVAEVDVTSGPGGADDVVTEDNPAEAELAGAPVISVPPVEPEPKG